MNNELLTPVPSTEEQRQLLANAIDAIAKLAQDSLNRLPAESRREVERRMRAGVPLNITFALVGGAVAIRCDLHGFVLFAIEVPKPEPEKAATMH